MVLRFWALHPHSDGSDCCLLEQDICSEEFSHDVAEGVSIHSGVHEEVWEDGCKEQEGGTSLTQSPFTIPVELQSTKLITLANYIDYKTYTNKQTTTKLTTGN